MKQNCTNTPPLRVIFPCCLRAQLNARYALLIKQKVTGFLRDFNSPEMCWLLWNPSIGFHEIWQSTNLKWRRVGLVVSVSDFQHESRWFEPVLCNRVVSINKKLYTALTFFAEEYLWVPTTKCWG